MDPAHFIETANELRGLGTKLTKTDTVRPVKRKHSRPQAITQPWCDFAAGERPGSTRNPALGTEWVLAPVEDNMMPDAIVDGRNPTEIIGVSTRACEHMTQR